MLKFSDLKSIFSVSESDLTKCSKHNKTLIKAVLCHEHDNHNTVICEDCEIECKSELIEEKIIAEFKQYPSVQEIDKNVADGCSRVHNRKLFLLSKLGRKSEERSIDYSSQHIVASTVNEETLLCKEISKANYLEIWFTKEIMPFIEKKRKTLSEKKIYFWKVECLLQSLKPELKTSADSKYLKQFEEFMYTNDICVGTADKKLRAYIKDTAKSRLTGKFISRLRQQIIKENITLTLCEEISEIADDYEPIIVVCLLDTRYDLNIYDALSCVEAIDNRRIVFISLHYKSQDARIEDFTKSVTENTYGKKYKDLGMVIDWYDNQNDSQEKLCLDKVILFLERYLPDKGKHFCQLR